MGEFYLFLKSRLLGWVLILAATFVSAPSLAGPVLFGSTLNGSCEPCGLIKIDPGTGETTPIGNFGNQILINGLTYHSNLDVLFGFGRTLDTSESTLYRIDQTTGIATAVGTTGLINGFGLEYDPLSNQLFATTEGGQDPSLYTVDPFTAEATLVGSLNLPAGVGATRELAFDFMSQTMFLGTEGVSNAGQDFNGLNVINIMTGNSNFFGIYKGEGPPDTFNNVRAIAYDSEQNRLVGVNGAFVDQFIEIDEATGQATILTTLPGLGGSTSTSVLGLAFVQSTPSLPGVALTKDSFLLSNRKNFNEGANHYLVIEKQGNKRTVVGFDLSQMTADVTQATLNLTIAESPTAWGTDGGWLDVHRITESFTEGIGFVYGQPRGIQDRGEGAGVTWNCSTDTDISNRKANCDGRWNGGSDAIEAVSDSTVIINGQTGEVSWDVTVDVQAALGNGDTEVQWLIKKANENKKGKAAFYSKEGAACLRGYDEGSQVGARTSMNTAKSC